MPAIVLTLLQGLLLLLLYVFIARAVRAVVRDVTVAAPAAQPARRPSPRPAAAVRSGARTPAGQLVVHVPDGRPRVVDLRGSTILFGRSQDATVRLNDPYISERHAKVHREDGEWLVTDLGSTNGTFVNQVKVTGPTPIAAGDQLGIGRTVVEVRR